jgi:hypothetical protein
MKMAVRPETVAPNPSEGKIDCDPGFDIGLKGYIDDYQFSQDRLQAGLAV